MENNIFNNPDLFPTPPEVIDKMLKFIDIEGKVILEPSAGSGNIVNRLLEFGAKDVLYCEKSKAMQSILSGKGRFMCDDFLNLKSEEISHINAIVMNPPFSEGVKHILHAYEIAPKGTTIVSLINSSNIKNDYTNERKELNKLISTLGNSYDLGKCFFNAERKTDVDVSMITITKAGENYEEEFEGFFMEEEPETEGVNGIMRYDVIRDLVNRYVGAVKLYDEQLNLGVKMKSLLKGFYGGELTFSCSEDGKPTLRNEFKKSMQRAGWKFIFDELDLNKDVTRGTREKINKFIEEQTQIPFTVKNIWRMLEVIYATRGQTMDAALLEVFDRLTKDEANREQGKYKSNLHYLVGKKFILENMCWQDQRYYKGYSIQLGSSGNFDLLEDLNKALSYITGTDFKTIGCLRDFIRYEIKVRTREKVHFFDNRDSYSMKNLIDGLYERGAEYKIERSTPIYGEFFEWGYFRVKAFKKGTMHFEWLNDDVWGKFNQRIAKLKGYPLYEQKEQTDYQRRNAGYSTKTESNTEPKQSNPISKEMQDKIRATILQQQSKQVLTDLFTQ
jgi:predicted RNA methylase